MFLVIAIINAAVILILSGTYIDQALNWNSNWGDYTIDLRAIFFLRMLVGLCQFVSFVFLSIGTMRIRNQIIEKHLGGQIDTRMMLLHVLSFFLYFVSGLGFYAAEIHYYTTDISHKQQAVRHVLVMVSLGMFS